MKKFLSFFLVIVMVLGMVPVFAVTASAEGTAYSLVELYAANKIKLLGRTAPNPENTGLMCEWAGSGFQMNVSGNGGALAVTVSTNYYSTWVIQVDGEQIFRQHYPAAVTSPSLPRSLQAATR